MSFILVGCGSVGDRTVVTGVCKSCKPYYVRGSWHYPQNYYEYDEVGLASWYGPGFHGKPKPYGELFDQHALTAAHKTLPLPTIVEVTNLDTRQTVKVLIDDRGPFTYEGRIIDLSLAAAKAVGTYCKGVGKVRVRALVEESKALANYLTRYGSSARDPSGRTWWQIYEQEIAGRAPTSSYEIAVPPLEPVSKTSSRSPKEGIVTAAKARFPQPQTMTDFLEALESAGDKQQVAVKNTTQKPKAVASQSFYVTLKEHFVQKKNADKVFETLALEYPCRTVEVQHPSGQKFYTIRLGPFEDRKAAEEIIKNLADLGQSGAVISEK